MLRSISWSQFLSFLLVLVVFYYGPLLLIWYRKQSRKIAPFNPACKSERDFPKAAPVESPVDEAVNMTHGTLQKELRRWLCWSHSQGFARQVILLGIETHLNEFFAERLALNQEEFKQLLDKTLFDAGSISVSKEETDQLWNASGKEPSFTFRSNELTK